MERITEATLRYFKARGWRARLVDPAKDPATADLAPLAEGGLGMCGDGRKIIDPRTGEPYDGPLGPATIGGLHGTRALVTGGDRKGAARAIAWTLEQGFTPGLHKRCGLHGLAVEEKIDLPHPLRFDVLKDPVLRRKVLFYDVEGEHRERKFALNLERGYVPRLAADGSRFISNAHHLLDQGVGLPRLLRYSADAIEALSPCREVMVIAAS